MAKACASCAHWDVYESDEQLGDCRRRPPVVSPALLERAMSAERLDEIPSEQNVYIASTFPVTHKRSLCGEHEPLTEALPC